MDKFNKQPADVLDYVVDASSWLPESDTISGATVAVKYADDSAGVPDLTVDSYDVSTTSVRVWLSGGIDGERYEVTVVMTTTGGRTKEHEFQMRVKEI